MWLSRPYNGKMHPLTTNTYSNQWILLTLTLSSTTIGVTDNAQSFLLACSSIFLVFSSYYSSTDPATNYTLFIALVS